MPPEVEEMDAATRLAAQLFADPKTRPLMDEATALLYPERAHVAVPAYVMKKEVNKELDALKKERADYQAQREKDAADQKSGQELLAWRRGLVAAGAKVEEIPELEKFARERNNGNPDDVVLSYRNRQRLAEPRCARRDVAAVAAGQVVDDRHVMAALDQLVDHPATDEARTAGYEDFFIS